MLTSTAVNERVRALDEYWNPYVEVEDFNTQTEEWLDVNYRSHNFATSEVESVNVKSADIFWRGCSDVRSWKPELQNRDKFTTPAGHVCYPSFDKFGNRIIRHFDTADSNYTFRIRVIADRFVVEQFRNVRKNGKWSGRKIADVTVQGSCYSDLSEQRATYAIMAALSKSLTQ